MSAIWPCANFANRPFADVYEAPAGVSVVDNTGSLAVDREKKPVLHVNANAMAIWMPA